MKYSLFHEDNGRTDLKALKNKSALVLGCNGQDGSFICKSLLEKNYRVIGISRSDPDKSHNHQKLGIEKDIIKKKGDICDNKKISKFIERYQPDEIYNFAAQSSVSKSFNKIEETIKGIVNGTINLLETSRRIGFKGRIFFAGSSEIFGNTDTAADRNHPHNPMNPYAISKQTSFNLVKLYRENYNINCVTGILFNHESYLREDSFVTQKIIHSAKKIMKKGAKKIKLGNISVIRDWGWAPEYMEAVQLITNTTELKDHVICTGEPNSLQKFIELVFKYYQLDWKEFIEIDQKLFRPNEINKSYGNPKPLFDELGWQASSNLEEIVTKMINN